MGQTLGDAGVTGKKPVLPVEVPVRTTEANLEKRAWVLRGVTPIAIEVISRPGKRMIHILGAVEKKGLAGVTTTGVFPISIGGVSVMGGATIPTHHWGGISAIPAGCIQV